jgi:hypothetical protein
MICIFSEPSSNIPYVEHAFSLYQLLWHILIQGKNVQYIESVWEQGAEKNVWT